MLRLEVMRRDSVTLTCLCLESRRGATRSDRRAAAESEDRLLTAQTARDQTLSHVTAGLGCEGLGVRVSRTVARRPDLRASLPPTPSHQQPEARVSVRELRGEASDGCGEDQRRNNRRAFILTPSLYGRPSTARGTGGETSYPGLTVRPARAGRGLAMVSSSERSTQKRLETQEDRTGK
ncbi:hypothetical protein AOLI_G00001810 [Acnodon oligacanthus]